MKDKPVILVVDDLPENIELLEAYLVPQGYEIVKAASGEEALGKLSDKQIDLILLDVMMPGMDGFEVTRRVRQNHTHRLLPIILVTVLRETEDRVKGIEAGCDDFISYPVDKMELLARVRSLLKIKAYNDLMGNYQKELESEVTRRTEELNHALENLQQDITARKQAEEKLRESEKRYRELYDFLPIPVYEMDLKTNITSANRAIYETFRGTEEDLKKGFKAWQLLSPEEIEKSSKNIQRLLKGEPVKDTEYTLMRLDGSIFPAIVISKVIYSNDQPVGLRGAIVDITERKRTENALRASEEWFRKIFDEAHQVGIVITSPSLVFEKANPAFCRMMGYSADELRSMSFADITHPDHLQQDMENVNKVGRGETLFYQNEKRYINKSGEVLWGNLIVSSIRDEHGALQSYLSMVIDITKQKKAVELLLEATDKYQDLAESISDVFFALDKNLRYTYWNKASEKLTGIPAEEALAKSFVEIFPDNEARKQVKDMYLLTIETKKPQQLTVSYPGDELLVHEISSYPTKEGVSVFMKDVTGRRKAERALEESETKLRSILDHIGIGVALISPKMEVLDLNHQMREWFPAIDSAQNPICYRAFNDPPREEICDYCPTYKTLQDGLVHESVTQTPRSGVIRNYRIVSSPIFNASGEVTAAIEMVEDITEKLSLESQFRQAQKMESVGRLAGGVAHDFNNMLTVILGYTELAMMRCTPLEPIHADLKEIMNAAEHSAAIVQQLLAFARKQTINPKVLDLNETVEGMLKMLRRLIGEDIDLVWRPGSGLWQIKMDPSQVEQILANLCVNARDAINQVGKITIETGIAVIDQAYCADHPGFMPGEYATLTVSDDGRGMDQGTLDQIFEPFFTTKEVGHGTGLGLATVYGIVKQNNGFINVYSEPGKGTTFRVYLARQTDQSEDTQEDTQRETEGDLPQSQGETVLVVEDDVSILKLSSGILDTLGYNVLTAGAPSEALRLVEEYTGEIHLLIIDVILPEMNGRDLAEQIKKTRPTMKCLFMSGYTANVIAHRGMLAEGVQFMPKPFSIRDLAAKVRKVLEER